MTLIHIILNHIFGQNQVTYGLDLSLLSFMAHSFYYSLAIIEAHFAALHQIDETAGRGYEQMTSALQVADLCANVGATIDNAGAHVSAVGKLKRENKITIRN